MADKLFIKHNLGSFQQPYIFQAPANTRLPFIRQTPAPYPYIANNQQPNIRRQPAPYPYIANAQEPNIRRQPVPYPYIANGQQPNIRRQPAPYPYIASNQQPNIRQQPAPYPYIANRQNPVIRQQPAPYPYIANAQEPNIRRTPSPYPYIAAAQQPLIKRTPAPYPYIASAQEPNIRQTSIPYPYIANNQQPNIRSKQQPYPYPAAAQVPFTYAFQNSVNYNYETQGQNPVIRQTPTPYEYTANRQNSVIRRTPSPYPYNAQAQNPFIRQTPAPYPYIASAQTPFIRDKQTPAIGVTGEPTIAQTPVSAQGITQVSYQHQQPHIIAENMEWTSTEDPAVVNTPQTRLTLDGFEAGVSVGFELIITYLSTTRTALLQVRDRSSGSFDGTYEFRDEDGTITLGNFNTTVGTITFPTSMGNPDGVRLVVANAAHTGTATSAQWFPIAPANATYSLQSNFVTSGGLTNTSVGFASLANATFGCIIVGSHNLNTSTEGEYSSQLDGDLFVQFSESGFNNFTHTYALPIRSNLTFKYQAPGGPGTPTPGIEQ